MVNVLQEKEKTLYQCAECTLRYRDQARAEACEAWCKAHSSCNLDIIKDAEKEGD